MSFHVTILITYKGGKMLNLLKTFLGSFILILVLIGCEENTVNPDVNDNDNLRLDKVTESATGSGHIEFNGELRVFTHNARNKSNGTVNGHFNVNRHDTGIHFGGSVICLNVDGNTAYFAGVIETSNSEITAFDPGSFIVWSTIDNGEGSGNLPDQITLITGNAPWTEADVVTFCENGVTFSAYLDIEQGNIQIR